MKLAVIVAERSNELPIFLHDNYGKSPVLFTLGPRAQLALLVVLIAALFGAWAIWIEPKFPKLPPPAVRVPRAQQVNPIEPGMPLKVGDVVFASGKNAPVPARITALPRQTVKVRTEGGVESFVMLGGNSYYIVAEDGAGQMITLSKIRGLVQTHL